MNKRNYDLEERLLNFAADIIRLVESLPRTKAATHLGGQLLRSGTSPLLNHAEVQAAESGADFVHKLRICLKELRESNRTLKLIGHVPLVDESANLGPLLGESEELIRIFVSSVRTAKRGSEER